MRTKKAIRNSISSAISFLIITLVGLIAQKVFLDILGTEILGLNGLYNNIISMLSISELGIGLAIISNLYKPVAANDKEKIKSLLAFYKKAYHIIIIIIIILSILFLPFLKYIVGEISSTINIYIIFGLYVFDSVSSYLIAYKRSILYATQENYIINYIHLGYILVLNFIQILILKMTSSFVLYLIIKIIMRYVENIAITLIVNKKYPYLKDKNITKIDSQTKNNIFKKIKGLIFHRIGAFVVMGTDNILISYFFGVSTVGIYYNYNVIIAAVNSLITQTISATTSSVGNLLATENKKKVYSIYKNINFINYTLALISSLLLLNLIQPFISLWVGKEYSLESSVIIVLVINFFLTMMRRTISIFKEASGIFYEDRFVPVLESIMNIVFSVVLAKLFGLSGIFLGTILSTLFLFLYDFPKYGYKIIFERKSFEFIIDFIKYLLLTLLIIVMNYALMYNISLSNMILELLIKGFITVVVNCAIIWILFRKTTEFKYELNIIKNLFINKIKRLFQKRNN